MSFVQVNLSRLLDFYDVLNVEVRGHAGSIKAISEEEMNLALLIHYMRKTGGWPDAEVLNGTPSTKGARLDAWVCTGGAQSVLYQVEVKNWSVHGYNGKSLAYPAERSTARWEQYLKDGWGVYFENAQAPYRFKHAKELGKVLRKMNPPKGFSNLTPRPLACLWSAIHPSGSSEPLFDVGVTREEFDGEFDLLTIFSVSSYLRNMVNAGTESVCLDLPNLSERMNLLNQLFCHLM